MAAMAKASSAPTAKPNDTPSGSDFTFRAKNPMRMPPTSPLNVDPTIIMAISGRTFGVVHAGSAPRNGHDYCRVHVQGTGRRHPHWILCTEGEIAAAGRIVWFGRGGAAGLGHCRHARRPHQETLLCPNHCSRKPGRIDCGICHAEVRSSSGNNAGDTLDADLGNDKYFVCKTRGKTCLESSILKYRRVILSVPRRSIKKRSAGRLKNGRGRWSIGWLPRGPRERRGSTVAS